MSETLFPVAFEELIDQFAALPGIGRKSAQRLAFYILSVPEDKARDFAQTVLHARETVHDCPVCQNLTDEPICPICNNQKRDQSTICVVAEPKDVLSIERSREYMGVYHVLHGQLSPMRRIGPAELRIEQLVQRVRKGGIQEIIMATSYDAEGETTAMHISRLLRPYPVKVTRLASGMPIGSTLEFVDDATMLRALQGRHEI